MKGVETPIEKLKWPSIESSEMGEAKLTFSMKP